MDNVAQSDKYHFTVMTFARMGAESRKLGDFTPVSVSGKGNFSSSSNFYITFYDENGAQRLVKDDAQIQEMWPAAVVDPDVMNKPVSIAFLANKSGTEVYGWYLQADSKNKLYNLNNYVINDGDGFQYHAYKTFDQGVKLVCSGQVPNAVTPITVASDRYDFTGNVTVKSFTLGSLTPVSISGKGNFSSSSNFYITFYDDNGAQRLVKDDKQIQTLWPDAVVDPDVMNKPVSIAFLANKSGTEVYGWYLQADSKNKLYNMNNYVVNPADGFQIHAYKTFDQGVQINLPNALQ